MKIIIQFIFLAFLLTTYSCSKEEIEPPGPCPDGKHTTVIIPELEAYLFDTGSYWIYKDTSNLQTDSVYLNNWGMHSYPGNNNDCYTGYYYNFFTESSLNGPNNLHRLDGGSYLDNHFDNFNDPASFIIHDSISIGGNTLFGVKEFPDSISYFPNPDSFTKNFYKDSIGIVRIVNVNLSDTTTFDLINYQVSLFPRIL